MSISAGKAFRGLLHPNHALQIVGTINAYAALLAKQAGHQAIYLSGAGVANAAFGLPDLGITTLTDVLEEASRITAISPLPLLVDIDTGFGHAFNIARTIRLLERAGVAAVHIEDQVIEKRCGHRPGKKVVSAMEMGDRLKAALDARTNDDFVIMARTDAYSVEGMAATLDRAAYYIEVGADMLFPEAMSTLEEYQTFVRTINAPILANLTEFGKTPLFTQQDLNSVGVQMILYPLSAFRAMSQAALSIYEEIHRAGTQSNVLGLMQTREGLYHTLQYESYEKEMDNFLGAKDGCETIK